jgi:6-pyruvoyltetrahydropterin/6-carboxytetrahydropterin synthase
MSIERTTKLFRNTKRFQMSFRQWRAKETHCSFLHSYNVGFKLEFDTSKRYEKKHTLPSIEALESDWREEGILEDLSISLYRINKFIEDHLAYRILIAEDDPKIDYLTDFSRHNNTKSIIIPHSGCERFSEYLYNQIVDRDLLPTDITLSSVETYEHEKNSAIYKPSSETSDPFFSTKLYNGFSTLYKTQEMDSVYGTDLKIKLTFNGPLDDRNWVFDFGRLKRSNTLIDGLKAKEWLSKTLDHTLLDNGDLGFIDTEVLQPVSISYNAMEDLAEFFYGRLNSWVKDDTNNRVIISKLELIETDEKSYIVEA